jgi:hypothetical protein
MARRRLAALVLVGVAALPAAAAAGELGVSTGVYEPLEERFLDAEAGLELRLAPRLLGLVPVGGVMVTGEQSLYGYLGARRDFRLRGPWLATLTWAFGAYEESEGKDLGHTVQFRSGIEVGYERRDGSRLGLLLYHLSNAGLAESNPGSESLILTYSRPLRSGRPAGP